MLEVVVLILEGGSRLRKYRIEKRVRAVRLKKNRRSGAKSKSWLGKYFDPKIF
jgi:hypothetical protein